MLTNLFAPFPDFNQGMGGLQYQIAGFLAAQLPVDGSCDAETCYPMTPPGCHHRAGTPVGPVHRLRQRVDGPGQRRELRAVPELVPGAAPNT